MMECSDFEFGPCKREGQFVSVNSSEEQLDDKPTDAAGQARRMCVHARSFCTSPMVPPLCPEPEFSAL